jgi:hypothetical protein
MKLNPYLKAALGKKIKTFLLTAFLLLNQLSLEVWR